VGIDPVRRRGKRLYEAHKPREMETGLVRIPGASHRIAERPSRMIAKVAHVLKWFETCRKADERAIAPPAGLARPGL
jgi:hypothetical protein